MTHYDYNKIKEERFGSMREYLTEFERDQLDARAACAEQERDEAMDDLHAARIEIGQLASDLGRARLDLKIANIGLRETSSLAGTLRVTVNRIADLHDPSHAPEAGDPDRPPWCAECGQPYPCRTAQAIARCR